MTFGAHSRFGMVASADGVATQAGSHILALGGNAVDAALATNAAMAVVAPHLCGIGGDLFALVHVNGEVHALDAAGRAGSGVSAAQLRADLYLMGVTGVHADAGLTTGDFEEAAVKRALHERAAETVVLASADKLGAASTFTIAPLSELAALVVPASTPAPLRKKLQAGGVKVSTAMA